MRPYEADGARRPAFDQLPRRVIAIAISNGMRYCSGGGRSSEMTCACSLVSLLRRIVGEKVVFGL